MSKMDMPKGATPVNVALPDALRRFVDKRVSQGRYKTSSEVVRDALRLLSELDRMLHVPLETMLDETAARLGGARHNELALCQEQLKALRAALTAAEQRLQVRSSRLGETRSVNGNGHRAEQG